MGKTKRVRKTKPQLQWLHFSLEKNMQKMSGGGGYRSPYLMHAKHSLYHVSYTPLLFILTEIKIIIMTAPLSSTQNGQQARGCGGDLED